MSLSAQQRAALVRRAERGQAVELVALERSPQSFAPVAKHTGPWTGRLIAGGVQMIY